MGNVADACKSLTTKPVGTNRLEVFELLQLGRGKTFAKDR